MTKATQRTPLATLIVLGALLPGLFMACGKDQVAIAQQNTDGHVPDGKTGGAGSPATGGAVGTGGSALTGGSAAGGNSGSGGILTGGRPATGGSANGGVTSTGGAGGSAAGGAATGGVPRTGGAGGSATGGIRVDAAVDTTIALDTSMSIDSSTDAGKTCGGLAGLPCGANEICDPPANMCQVSDYFGTCKPKPQGCTADYRPVCGCDGKTYSNECSRLMVGVAKRGEGECTITSVACASVTTQAACDARGDCHSVFQGSGQFSACAVGGRADCVGTTTCANPVPRPIPSCTGNYALSYIDGCPDGCVLRTVCSGTDAGVAPTTCPPTAPTNGTACGATALSCFYDNCPGAGRTTATCTGGTWSAQTGACGAVTCAGFPNSSFSCPSGSVCVVRAGGAIMAECTANSCAAGPVSSQCLTAGIGCTMSASLTGGVTFTCNTCPQGGCP